MVRVMLLKLLPWVFLIFGLTGCALPTAIVYSLLEDPVILKEQNVVVRSFDLPKSRPKPIPLFFGHLPASGKNTGRFSINGKPPFEFKFDALKENEPNESTSNFDVPREWFTSKNNTIKFEHISGDGVTIENIILQYGP